MAEQLLDIEQLPDINLARKGCPFLGSLSVKEANVMMELAVLSGSSSVFSSPDHMRAMSSFMDTEVLSPRIKPEIKAGIGETKKELIKPEIELAFSAAPDIASLLKVKSNAPEPPEKDLRNKRIGVWTYQTEEDSPLEKRGIVSETASALRKGPSINQEMPKELRTTTSPPSIKVEEDKIPVKPAPKRSVSSRLSTSKKAPNKKMTVSATLAKPYKPKISPDAMSAEKQVVSPKKQTLTATRLETDSKPKPPIRHHIAKVKEMYAKSDYKMSIRPKSDLPLVRLPEIAPIIPAEEGNPNSAQMQVDTEPEAGKPTKSLMESIVHYLRPREKPESVFDLRNNAPERPVIETLVILADTLTGPIHENTKEAADPEKLNYSKLAEAPDLKDRLSVLIVEINDDLSGLKDTEGTSASEDGKDLLIEPVRHKLAAFMEAVGYAQSEAAVTELLESQSLSELKQVFSYYNYLIGDQKQTLNTTSNRVLNDNITEDYFGLGTIKAMAKILTIKMVQGVGFEPTKA